MLGLFIRQKDLLRKTFPAVLVKKLCSKAKTGSVVTAGCSINVQVLLQSSDNGATMRLGLNNTGGDIDKPDSA